MKMKLKDRVSHWFWRKSFNCFGNYYYLDRFKEKGDIEDIEKFLRLSYDIQMDMEELVNDGYFYSYTCNGEWCHAHSLPSLVNDITWTLIHDPDAEFDFHDDDFYSTYSDMDRLILDKLIRKLRELIKA